jgi:flagellar L-ring protein precursor FlgH
MRALWITIVAAAAAIAPASADSLLERESYRPLVADQRAYRSGDNLTVLITETASATATAKTTTNKKGAVNGAANASNSDALSAGANLNEDFTGGGSIERTGRLLAQLTVTVQAVDKDGNLWVKGEQEILVNEEKQWIAVEGRVRLSDIRSDNTVLSTRVSEAKIRYTGNGLLAEKQKPGILTRFLSWLGIL